MLGNRKHANLEASMAKQCSKCGSNIGALDNHGSNEQPLCYDCADKLSKCDICGKKLRINEVFTLSNSQKACSKCKSEVERNELEAKQKEYQTIVNDKAKPVKTAGNPRFICSNCGYSGNFRKITKGSIIIELFLWLLFIIPGLIYSLWRLTSQYKACPKCEAPNMVPIDSPRGIKLAEEFGVKKP